MKITFTRRNLIIYLAFLAAGIVFASFFGGAVAYAPLSVLFLLLPVSALYIFICYRFLRVYQEVEVHKLTKGEVHRYRASFENAGLLPIHEMGIVLYRDRCSLYDIPAGTRLSLNARQKKELKSGINCLFAGAYYVGIESVSFAAPFHIFEVTLDVPYSFRALVKPRITDIAGKALDLENLFNSTGQKSLRLFEDTPGSDVRPYVKGDPKTGINWKILARTGELMVRIPDKMEKRCVSIIMNTRNTPERQWDNTFLKSRDFFLEFVVSAARHFTDQGIPLTIIYPAGRIMETRIDSDRSFTEFYERISDGLFYSSDEDKTRLEQLIAKHRDNTNDRETWIIINENPSRGENFIDICS